MASHSAARTETWTAVVVFIGPAYAANIATRCPTLENCCGVGSIPPMGVTLDMFAAEASPRVCEAGEEIFRAFDMAAEMYVVLEGEVELLIDSKVLETLGPGQPFGEMALIDQAPRTAT